MKDIILPFEFQNWFYASFGGVKQVENYFEILN